MTVRTNKYVLPSHRSESTDVGSPWRRDINLEFHNIRFSIKRWSLGCAIKGNDIFVSSSVIRVVSKYICDTCCSGQGVSQRGHLPKVEKEILKGVSGRFKANRLTAVMGPSGAGKSSLLDVLAAYRWKGVSGSVLLNDKERVKNDDAIRKNTFCYIPQNDYLRLELKVYEAMNYAADLKLGSRVSKRQKNQQVSDLLKLLGLFNCWDVSTCNLSGGQKKRLSLALELLSNPSVLFLDEPTTGLDSSSCSQCVSLLKILAQQGRTVICTMHQPSALIFDMIDDLYVLSQGECIYSGEARNLIGYLMEMNLVCPQLNNPADFLLDIACGEFGADVTELVRHSKLVVDEQLKLFKFKIYESELLSLDKNSDAVVKSDGSEECGSINLGTNSISIVEQFSLLYSRQLLIIRRKPTNILVRVAAHLLIALMFGYFYRDVGEKATMILANYCYIYGTNLFVVYTGKMSIICCFLHVPLSYYLTGQPLDWNRFTYFTITTVASSLAAQACGFLLGVTVPKKVSVFLGPVLACLLSVFGFCLRFTDTPIFFKWLYYISYFRASFQSSVYSVYGLNRSALACDNAYCHFKNPSKILTEMDIPHTISMEVNFGIIFVWILTLHVLTLTAIWLKLTRK
ncbi:hypothetical protein RUM43_009618 [Polyplax serrata]|uniref:ABC transporter domain-containing protein n=1 Tax=Polyplax serrata TaxID=468196 RepID=A0AAN8S6S2_POLSC